MNSVFDITGDVSDKGNVFALIELKDVEIYINVPECIDERNVYNIDTKEVINTIKPSKYGGLTYRVMDFVDDFAKITTSSYGECLIKITKMTTLTNYPVYERGTY